MSDDFRENGHIHPSEDVGVERLSADLGAIYDQLAHDGDGWARRLPEASSLQGYARALVAGTATVDAIGSPEDSRAGVDPSDTGLRRPEPERLVPATHVRPSRRAVWGAALSAVAIVALLASVFALIPRMRSASAPSTPAATATSQPPSCPPDQISLKLPPFSELTKLVMTSPTEGWAIGDTRNTTTWLDNPDPLMVRFHQCRWETIPSPVPGTTAFLRDLSMDTADDGWAVGTRGDATQALDSVHCLLLHYTGGQWRPAPVPSAIPSGFYSSCDTIAMLSPEEGWMLANWGSNDQPGTSNHLLHYTAGAWTPVDMPITGTYALSIVGPDDVWVAGTRPPATTDPNRFMRVDMAHYQHGQWTTFHLAAGAEAPFHFNSPSDGWLFGNPIPEQVLHYDGTSWQRSAFTDHAPSTDGAIDVLDANDAWAYTEIDRGPQSTLTSLQHYVGGQWQDVPWPLQNTGILSSIIRVAPSDYWAYGEHIYSFSKDSTVWQSVLLHYVGGVWYEYGA